MKLYKACPFSSFKMIADFLNRLFSSSGKLEQKTPASIEVLSGDERNEEPAVSIESKYDDPEIAIVDKYYGPMAEGMVIEVALADMLQILPRTRRKSDAYKGLVNRLKALGVQLRVASHYESKLNGNKD